MTIELLQRGSEAARVGPWRGARGAALLSPARLGPPSPSFLRWCCEQLAGRGFERVVSSALLPSDTDRYREAGFEVLEQLHLLSRSLDAIPTPREGTEGTEGTETSRLRRGRARDIKIVVRIDNAAFQPFWRFDADGIAEARKITPRSRFRVAEVIGPVGYAVTGLGEEQGYLQRLAVAPEIQRRGVGSALVIDALCWLARRRAKRVMVNTQLENEAALQLYLHLGFKLEPVRLEVLSYPLR